MPEGHTIHRHARRQREALVGQRIALTSPQGRFAAGAQRLNGRRLETIDAHGKHLFYQWDSGDVLHVHLGLFGKFKVHRSDPPPPPTENTRLTMRAGQANVYLAGPTICEVISPDEEQAVRSRLGPDPLRNGSPAKGIEQFAANLARRTIPVGAVLLDQTAIAGIGNVYRAEALFLTGIEPRIPAKSLSSESVAQLWRTSSKLLKQGERAGRIITVDPAEVGARRRRDLSREERLYVYGRHGEPCRRCSSPIALAEMANRRIWWCPRCQPDGAGA